MARFSDAQVGDKVYCLLAGEGEIIDFFDGVGAEDCLIEVEFKEGNTDYYMVDGKLQIDHIHPSLFYMNSTSKFLVERPEQTVAASILPVDTKLAIPSIVQKDSMRPRYFAYLAFGKIKYWDAGATSWSSPYAPTHTEHNEAFLAEDTEIDGVLYPAGTRVEAK